MTVSYPKKAVLNIKPPVVKKKKKGKSFLALSWGDKTETTCCGVDEFYDLSCYTLEGTSLKNISDKVTRKLRAYEMWEDNYEEIVSKPFGMIATITTAVTNPAKLTKQEADLETAARNSGFIPRTIFQNGNSKNTVTIWHKPY